MTDPRGHNPDLPRDGRDESLDRPSLEDLVDAVFDNELPADQSEDVHARLRRHPDIARDAVMTRRALESLRRPVSTPDLSGSILDALDGKRPMQGGDVIGRLRVWRYAAAAALLLMVAGAFTVQRMSPEVTHLVGTPEDRPMGTLAATLPVVTEQTTRDVLRAVDEIQLAVTDATFVNVAGPEPRPVTLVSHCDRVRTSDGWFECAATGGETSVTLRLCDTHAGGIAVRGFAPAWATMPVRSERAFRVVAIVAEETSEQPVLYRVTTTDASFEAWAGEASVYRAGVVSGVQPVTFEPRPQERSLISLDRLPR
ncbi:MAG: hypothetical protein AAGD00_02010 [Planctomycetota bacterium]